MAEYIKSKSSFVKKQVHQNTNDGSTIYERDWTTIGNIERYVPNQTPIYQSGNFIITVDNSLNLKEDENYNGDIIENITLDDLKKPTEEEKKNSSLNNNIYDLRTFAYFGSCTELIKSSITNIIKTYPFELYFSDRQVYYTIKPLKSEEVIIPFGKSLNINGEIVGKDLFLIQNPSNIDLYSVIKQGNDFILKNQLHGKYKLIQASSEVEINESLKLIYTNGTPKNCYVLGEEIGYVDVNDYKIFIYQGYDNQKLYFHESENNGLSIRPNKEEFDLFYNKLDKFSQILLNPNTTPKYKAIFNVITPTEYGLKTIQESFIFPKSDGNWNIGGDDEQFQSYLSRLYKISEYYDEYFSDNIWRMMTHESIKNFDWTLSRESNENRYIEGGEKISKIIRLYGREFDEIKRYVDNIKFTNNLNYQDQNTIQDEYLKNLVENEGWSVKKFKDDDFNNYFLKVLRLNSREILKHKGTIEGIELILSLLGYKSNRMDNTNFNYTIKEYIYNIPNLMILEEKDDNKILSNIKILNSEKDDYNIFNEDKYQGLSVIEYNNKLYPYYDNNKNYDNGLYYQMNGGWIDSCDKPNNVETKAELNTLPYSYIYPNMIVKVNKENKYYKATLDENSVYSWTETSKPIRIYDLYDIHLSKNNYDYGMLYLNTILNPLQYHLENNLFNIENKNINNFIFNEVAKDYKFVNKTVDLTDLSNNDKITYSNNIEESLKIINVKNIEIIFNDITLKNVDNVNDIKNIITYYLQQVIPSTIIWKLVFNISA